MKVVSLVQIPKDFLKCVVQIKDTP